VCVLLAASSAISDRGAAQSSRPSPLQHLKLGQVAVPVSLASGGVVGLLEAGQHVGLLSAHSLLADHLLVLQVAAASPDGGDTTSILVAADRPTALRIAKLSGETVLAVVDKS
jgi:hypothetical protein